MVAESEMNFVWVSDLLACRFPSVCRGLERILSEYGVGFGSLAGTRDIWVRDFMPVQVDRDGSFVLFRYLPDYLRHGYRHLITDAREIIPGLSGVRSCEFSDIVLDGGNVVRHHDKAVVTDRVFRENPGMRRADLRRELRRLLKLGTLIVIPTEPGDVVGHADGVVRFVDEGTVLVNGYRDVDGRYRSALRRLLRAAGLCVIELPYLPEAERSGSIPSAFGCYLNHLQVGRVVVVPSYGLPEDKEVQRAIRRWFPGSAVRSVDCSDLSFEGGVLNCVTWDVLGV